MAKQMLTAQTARAAGWDAGNRSMRDAGRSVWDADDFDAASACTRGLLLKVPFELDGLAGVELASVEAR